MGDQVVLIHLDSSSKMVNWLDNWIQVRRQNVLSEVPQEFVVRPLLFLVGSNVFDNNIASKILKFADDTKSFRMVGSYDNTGSLQYNLDKVVVVRKVAIVNIYIQVIKMQIYHIQ